MESITIKAPKKEIEGTVQVPLSKSISNRILMISAISEGMVRYNELSDADDTILLKRLLDQIKKGEDHSVNAGNAGTAMRFLTAYLANTPGEWTLDGDERMRQRPIRELVEALRELGADIRYHGKEGFPPLKITGSAIYKHITTIDPGRSSQFVSALMMIGPTLPEGIKIGLKGIASSFPYIEMTAGIMRQAGADVEVSSTEIKISGGGYAECTLDCEADWSAAAPWYQLIALSDSGKLIIQDIKKGSLQGDRHLANYFSLFGVQTEYRNDGIVLSKIDSHEESIDLDLSDQPDLAPSLIITTAAKFLEGNFRGLSNLRIKESDRLEALSKELDKAGVLCQIGEDTFSFRKQKMIITKAVDTYNDHRMAMAFAPLALQGNPISINDPSVVSKSYPGFWEELGKVLGVEG